MSEYRLSEEDACLFNEGTHFRLHERLGAHLAPDGNGCFFGVWAPNAISVSVIGDFNGWASSKTPLELDERTGTWHGFVPGVSPGSL